MKWFFRGIYVLLGVLFASILFQMIPQFSIKAILTAIYNFLVSSGLFFILLVSLMSIFWNMLRTDVQDTMVETTRRSILEEYKYTDMKQVFRTIQIGNKVYFENPDKELFFYIYQVDRQDNKHGAIEYLSNGSSPEYFELEGDNTVCTEVEYLMDTLDVMAYSEDAVEALSQNGFEYSKTS